jgi:integrase
VTIKFGARTVDSLKPIGGKRTDYFDASTRGLCLRVTPNGAKSWSVLYRHRGKLRRLTLGSADVVKLADARDRARDALNSASEGADPAADKQQEKKAETIADLATDYIERYAKKRKKSWKEDDRILRAEVLPHWKQRAIADITRRDVRMLVEKIAQRAPIMANRTTALLSKMFRFAMDDELIESSPAAHISRPAPEQKRDRVLSETEIRQLWNTFDGLPREMGTYYKLRLVTAQRGGEVSSMQWEDVDLDAGWWTIPAARSKNKLAHRVPLNATALKLLQALRPSGDATGYVLAGARGRRQQSEAAGTFGVADFRGHDLRRTAASLMAGGGVPRLIISKLLNHVESGVTAVYDRHSYDAEKAAALTWWNEKLTAILENKPGARVLAFQRGA